MTLRPAALTLVALCCAAGAAGQTPATHGTVPRVHALRTTTPIVVDGQLTEEIWLKTPAATEFIQREPDEGKPVSEATELRIAYDEAALYIGARLRDREPARIARQLARRDQDAEADSFTILLDPHHDHLTGASFAVSAAGVQMDWTIFNDTAMD